MYCLVRLQLDFWKSGLEFGVLAREPIWLPGVYSLMFFSYFSQTTNHRMGSDRGRLAAVESFVISWVGRCR